MAVKTTKIQCNQDVDLRGKVDVEGKVTCGSDVEVDGKLQINSAKDLVTKDGSSLGDTIPTLEITKTDDGMFLTSSSLTIVKSRVGTHSPIGKATINFGRQSLIVTFYENAKLNEGFDHPFICSPMLINLGLINIWSMITINLDTGEIQTFSLNNYTGFVINDTNVILADESSANYHGTMYINTINGKPIVSGTESKDIKLQSTLYRHTVTIWNNNNASLIFTAESEKNTPIDSIQDLVTVFGNTKLACSGMKWESPSSIIHIMRLDVGTSISDTNVYTAGSEDGSFGEETFSDILGATGLIITDTVTAM